jgi:hypothetical protein
VLGELVVRAEEMAVLPHLEVHLQTRRRPLERLFDAKLARLNVIPARESQATLRKPEGLLIGHRHLHLSRGRNMLPVNRLTPSRRRRLSIVLSQNKVSWLFSQGTVFLLLHQVRPAPSAGR